MVLKSRKQKTDFIKRCNNHNGCLPSEQLTITYPLSLMKEFSCFSLNSKLREWARNSAARLPNLITQTEEPLVNDQWKMYQGETIPAEWQDNTNGKPERQDHFWKRLFEVQFERGTKKCGFQIRVGNSFFCISQWKDSMEGFQCQCGKNHV